MNGSDFNEAIEINPKNSEGWKRRGNFLINLSFILQNLSEMGCYKQLGQARVALGLVSDALSDFSTAIGFDNKDAEAYYQR